MSVGKIDELVSEKALAQLDELYQRLGITKTQMESATEQAAKFTAALGDTKNLQDFQAAQAKVSDTMQQAMATQAQYIAQQKEVVVQTQAVADAVKVKVTTDANADAMLRQVGGTLDANIKLLVQQKLQLKEVNDQLKQVQSAYAGTTKSQQSQTQSAAELTKQQLQLKEAIAAQSLVIKQQVKDNNAATGSQDQMLARLNQLRKAYNSLSEEERNNAQVGGVLLGNIKQLASATAEINQQQGKYNDSVGKYEDAIKSAISSYVPFGNQIVKAVDTFNKLTKEGDAAGAAMSGVGTQFASFSIGAFAVGMAAATYYLQQFRNTGQDVDQFLGGLKAQFANFGKNVVDMFNGKKPKYGAWTNFINSFTQGVDVTKMQQDVKNLNEINDQQIQIMQAQADQFRAQSKNVGESAAKRAEQLQKAQAIENKIVAKQKSNAGENINAAIALAQKGAPRKLLGSRLDQLTGKGAGGFTEAAQAANDLAQSGQITEAGYEALMTAYQRQTQAMNTANMKLIRQQNDAARLELKQAKAMNNDQLELQKARLEGEKETARLILDNDKNGYDQRFAALKTFVEKSKSIISVENVIANRAPGISGTKKAANNQIAANQSSAVDIFSNTESAKMAKQAQADILKIFKEQEVSTTAAAKEGLNNRLLDIEDANAKEAEILRQQYEDKLLTKEQYDKKLRVLDDQTNIERIQAEIKTEQQLLDIQTSQIGLLSAGGADTTGARNAQSASKTKLRTLGTQLTRANTKLGSDQTADEKGDTAKRAKDIGAAIGYVEQLQTDANAILEASYANQISLLEQKKQALQDAANVEINGINNSILSNKEKQREINIVNAQAKAAQDQINEQEKQIKRENAETDRALAIARIIENVAIGVTAATGSIFGLPLVPVIEALGAAQLAAVLATPLPKFEKGGTVGKDGNIITGEAGTELRIDPNGAMSLTKPYANVSYAQAGTKIINNKELVRMMAKPEAITHAGGVMVDLRKLERLSEQNNDLQKRSKRPVVIVQAPKFGEYSAKRNY